MRVKYLAQEHNTVSLARARNRTARSGVEHTNHEATAPPQLVLLGMQNLRTVPTKYKGFCARLGSCGKSRSLQWLSESTKKKEGSHAFFQDN